MPLEAFYRTTPYVDVAHSTSHMISPAELHKALDKVSGTTPLSQTLATSVPSLPSVKVIAKPGMSKFLEESTSGSDESNA